MALRILEIITNAGPHSDLTGEREADPTGKDRWDWAFIEVLTGADGQAGFEASTLQKSSFDMGPLGGMARQPRAPDLTDGRRPPSVLLPPDSAASS